MTEVSNPPEYASTTLSTDPMTLPKQRGKVVYVRGKAFATEAPQWAGSATLHAFQPWC